MKNPENVQVEELTLQELQQTDGGVAVAIGITVGIAMSAYIYYTYFD